ncbi:MAG: hypothetical protein NTZ17_20270 [Phycisphaerae bacterium]|nr:hypothetical protein [Phycisphaerae bacterium]
MTESTKLTRRQAAVIEDLFTSKLDEQKVLEKHHVSPRLFEQWLADKRFAEQLERRIAHAHRQSRMILAHCVPEAATKLAGLMDSQNQETARKACLDIISLEARVARQESPDTASDPAGSPPAHTLSTETASRLLAALACGGGPQAGSDRV